MRSAMVRNTSANSRDSFTVSSMSFISDTTIAATRTQECDMRDKFKVNSMIVGPAAVAVASIYLLESLSVQIPVQTEPVEWVKVLPYLVVLGTALELQVGSFQW